MDEIRERRGGTAVGISPTLMFAQRLAHLEIPDMAYVDDNLTPYVDDLGDFYLNQY